MGILSGNQTEEPLHYGEVFTMWSNLLGCYGMIATYQTFYNHAGDEELKKLIEEFVQVAKEEVSKLESILKANGVALPPAPPERAEANADHIPPGAKFNDPEISAALTIDTGSSLVACSQAMSTSTREDIAMMYGQFHLMKAQLGYKLLRLIKKKGWLVLPPLHIHHLHK